MADKNRKMEENIKKETVWPMRLNKFLSDAGVCSRREADRLTEAGRVFVDGQQAVLGTKVEEGQEVCVDGKVVQTGGEGILIAFHKPAGVECTTDASNPDNIVDFIHYPVRIYPIGRLDKNSTGLILLTNVGSLVNKILKSSNYHEKEYQVETDHPLTEEFLNAMRAGVTIHIDNENRTVTTRECKVTQTGSNRFSIILTQGYNRQIRRMCRALGYEVTALKRVRIMNILLGDLPEGTYRNIEKEELQELLKELGE